MAALCDQGRSCGWHTRSAAAEQRHGVHKVCMYIQMDRAALGRGLRLHTSVGGPQEGVLQGADVGVVQPPQDAHLPQHTLGALQVP